MKAFLYPESAELCAILPDKGIAAAVHVADPSNSPGMMVSFAISLCDTEANVGRCLIYLGVYDPGEDSFIFLVHQRNPVKDGVLHACGMHTIHKFWQEEPVFDFMHHYLNLLTSNVHYTLSEVCLELNQDAVAEITTFFDRDFEFSKQENMCHNGLVLESNLVI